VAEGLGGLVVRAALPWMQEHSPKLFLLMTLETPHLGFCNGTLPCRPCAHQRRTVAFAAELALTDTRNQRESCLFRMSADATVGRFKQVVLVAFANGSSCSSSGPYASTLLLEKNNEAVPSPGLEHRKGRWRAIFHFVPLTPMDWLGMALIPFVGYVAWYCWPAVQDVARRRFWSRTLRLAGLALVLLWLRIRALHKSIAGGAIFATAGAPSAEKEMLQQLLGIFKGATLTRLVVDAGDDLHDGRHTIFGCCCLRLSRLGLWFPIVPSCGPRAAVTLARAFRCLLELPAAALPSAAATAAEAATESSPCRAQS